MDVSRGPFEPFWGHKEDLPQEILFLMASKVSVRSLRSIFFQNLAPVWDGHFENAAGKGLCWPILGYVGPSGVYVGAMFADLGAYWDHIGIILLHLKLHLLSQITKGSFRRATLSFILRSKGVGWKAPKIDLSIIGPPPLPPYN